MSASLLPNDCELLFVVHPADCRDCASRFVVCLAASVASIVTAAAASTTSFSRNCPPRVSKGQPVTLGLITKVGTLPPSQTTHSNPTQRPPTPPKRPSPSL